MTLRCRIKKALGIQSPSADGVCKIKLHCNNKKRCERCKHFEISKYNCFVCGTAFFGSMKKATENLNEQIQKFKDAISKL